MGTGIFANEYKHYRPITAKFDNISRECGHAITTGDTIGYHPMRRVALCAICWRAWQAQHAPPACKNCGQPAEVHHASETLCSTCYIATTRPDPEDNTPW